MNNKYNFSKFPFSNYREKYRAYLEVNKKYLFINNNNRKKVILLFLIFNLPVFGLFTIGILGGITFTAEDTSDNSLDYELESLIMYFLFVLSITIAIFIWLNAPSINLGLLYSPYVLYLIAVGIFASIRLISGDDSSDDSTDPRFWLFVVFGLVISYGLLLGAVFGVGIGLFYLLVPLVARYKIRYLERRGGL